MNNEVCKSEHVSSAQQLKGNVSRCTAKSVELLGYAANGRRLLWIHSKIIKGTIGK